jgi:glycosyltransferase involved in cell wall biosynthesis
VRAGAPIVATDVGGTAETLADAGHLVPPRAEELAQGIGHVLRDPSRLEDLRQRSRARGAELPTPEDVLSQLRRAYAS